MKNNISWDEILQSKGIKYMNHKNCIGCFALTALTPEEALSPNGPMRKNLSEDELRRSNLFGECDLGFKQYWNGWQDAIPLEKCPKPKTQKIYFMCIGKIT